MGDQPEESDDTYEGYGEMFCGTVRSEPSNEVKHLQEEAIEFIESLDEKDANDEGVFFLRPDGSITVFTTITMIAAVIEELSIINLTEEIADAEQGSKKSASEYFEEELSQYQRQKLLFHSGIIDLGTHGEMDIIRDQRNDIVHSSRDRKMIEDREALKNTINGGVRAVETLWERLD